LEDITQLQGIPGSGALRRISPADTSGYSSPEAQGTVPARSIR